MVYSTQFSGVIRFDAPLTGDALTEVQDLIKTGLGNGLGFDGGCDWKLTADNTGLQWNGTEKSYDMEVYAASLVELAADNGVVCNGTVEAQGQDSEDRWAIVVKDNDVQVKQGHFVYDD